MMTKPKILTVEQWDDSLALRIPAAIAEAGLFKAGQPVQISLQNSVLMVKRLSEDAQTLEQKLAAFDPQLHGGEVMATEPIGIEQ